VHCLDAWLVRQRAVLGLVARGFELLGLEPVLAVLKPGSWVVDHLAAVPVAAAGPDW
jgi:hypothetical protein